MAAIEDLLKTPPSTVNVDPTTSGLLADFQHRSQNTTPGIIGGVDQSQFNAPGAAGRQGGALGGADQSQSILAALGQRNQKTSSDFVNNLKSKIAMNAPVREMQGAQQSLQNLGKSNQVDQFNYQVQKQQMMNEQRVAIYRQQQQNSILAGILGIIGTIGGGIIGGLTGGAIGGKK